MRRDVMAFWIFKSNPEKCQFEDRLAYPNPVTPRDEWERVVLGVATDCGTSLSDSAVSSEGIYE
jgi:hypothetical protein